MPLQNQPGPQSYAQTSANPSIGGMSTRGPNDGTAGTGMGGQAGSGMNSPFAQRPQRTWFSQSQNPTASNTKPKKAGQKPGQMGPQRAGQAKPAGQANTQGQTSPTAPRPNRMMQPSPMMQPPPTPVPQVQGPAPVPPMMQPPPQVPMFGANPPQFFGQSYWPMQQMFGSGMR